MSPPAPPALPPSRLCHHARPPHVPSPRVCTARLPAAPAAHGSSRRTPVSCTCGREPSARLAKVTRSAPAASSAAWTHGSSHSGAWSARVGHHASPRKSLQSARFSSAQGTSAASTGATIVLPRTRRAY
eukprot:6188338-Pleurochrysis_carterae.AAC.1